MRTDVSILSMTKDVFIQNIFNTYRYILIVFKCRSNCKLNFPLVIVAICLMYRIFFIVDTRLQFMSFYYSIDFFYFLLQKKFYFR